MTNELKDELKRGKTIVYLVRHGDREFIPGAKLPCGPVPDSGLSKLGKKQAKAVAKKFGKIKSQIDIFYSSSMGRAAETASYMEKQIGIKPTLSDKLWEFNKIRFSNPYHKYHFWKHYIKHWQRMMEFNKILRENKGKTILVVAHGNLIKGILMAKKGISKNQAEREDYKNCYISLLKFNGTKLESVVCFNSKTLPKKSK